MQAGYPSFLLIPVRSYMLQDGESESDFEGNSDDDEV